jgi:hypothetical protein
MINILDIDRYLKVNKYWYKVWSYNALSNENDDYVIVDNSNNSVLQLYQDKNTGRLYTEVWNKDFPNLSHLFKYKRVLSIKFDEDICNIFLLEGIKK